MASEQACDGGDTVEGESRCCVEFRMCVHCGSEIAWDFVNHPFWGFEATCPMARTTPATSREEASTEQGPVTPSASEAL